MIAGLVQWLGRHPWVALVATLLIETVVFVAGQSDFVASDPLWYADIAHHIAVSPSDAFAAQETHPFVMRVGLTMPLALLYQLFGVSTFVTNLPSLLAALGILLVAYGAASTPRAKLLAMAFGLACTPLYRHGSILNVDLPCAALMACTVLFLSRRDRPRGTWWLVAAAVAWIAAFLVKETALWCGPVWIYAIVHDLRASGPRATARRFAPALIVGAALAAGYLVLCASVWGSPWARFRGIQALTHEHAWSLHGRPVAEWVSRLTWKPPLLVAVMFQATLVPALLGAWLIRGTERIWVVATATFLALYWFGPISASDYSLLPISPRMMLPILPGILVLAALGSDRALDRWRDARWRIPVVLALGLAVAVPAARAVVAMVTRPTPETAAFAVLRGEVADPSRRTVLVCGEPRCVPISNFYFGFRPPSNLTVLFAADFAAQPLPQQVTVRALVNRRRSAGVRRADPNLDVTRAIEALGLRALTPERGVRLYDATDGAVLWNALQVP